MSNKIYKKRGLERVTGETRMARCGHPSTTRYFKCENCLPELTADDDFIYIGNEGDDVDIENEFENDDDFLDLDLGCLE